MDKLKPKALAEIPLEVDFEFGRTKKTFEEILAFRKGTPIKLDNSVKQVINVYVNGVLFAYGKPMRQGDQMYLKITDVVNEGGK